MDLTLRMTREQNLKMSTRRTLTAVLLATLFLSGGCKKQASQSTNLPVANLGTPVRISSEGSNAAEPAVAVGSDGTAYVAWVEHRGKEADVMLSHTDGEGKSLGASVRVNPVAGQATAWRGDQPTVVVSPDQTVFVGWTARVESESGHATDIYLSASHDRGQTFSAPVKVNDDPKPVGHGMHALTIAKDGRIYVAWLDDRNVIEVPLKDMKMDAATKSAHTESNREVFMASSGDGGRTFSPNQRVATNVCPCCKVALATGSDGRVYVSWRQVLPGDFRHIAVASSTDYGKTFSSAVIVSDDRWVLAGCPVSGATLSIADDGVVQVLWYSEGQNGQTGLYWSVSRDHGATFGPRQLLAAGTTSGTPVLIGDGNALTAIWQDAEKNNQGVMIARNFSGATGSPAQVVAATGQLPAARANRERVFVAYVARSAKGQDIWLVSVGKAV